MIKEYERELNELQEGKLISKEDLHEGDEIIYNGEHYFVTRTDTGTDYVWITDDKSERYNRDAQGWTLKADWIDEVIGQPEEDELDESLKEDYKNFAFIVKCNDGPKELVRVVAEDRSKAEEYAKKMYAQNHTTYADDRHNIWSIDEDLSSDIDKVKHAVDQFKGQVTVSKDSGNDVREYLLSKNISFMIDDSKSAKGKLTFMLKYPIPKLLNKNENLSGNMTVADIAKKHNVDADVIRAQVDIGKEVEKEHTDNEDEAVRIALDHLFEMPDYYDKLKKMEKGITEGFETDNLTESKEHTQYGVHSFSQSSIIFRGTEEECAEFIADHNLWDDAEIYAMTPDDPHYLKEAMDSSKFDKLLDKAFEFGYNYGYSDTFEDFMKKVNPNVKQSLTKDMLIRLKDAFDNGNHEGDVDEEMPLTENESLKEFYNEDGLENATQEYTSANTSINSVKLPAIFSMVNFKPETINLDYGGGKFDNATTALEGKGVTNLVYDPYNRSSGHNKDVIDTVRKNGGADTVTCSNVLNVIKEPEARKAVIRNIYSLLKNSGTAYFTVYEGTGKGNEGPTRSGYQLNKKTGDYVEEISSVFPSVSRHGKLIIASKGTSITEEFDDDWSDTLETGGEPTYCPDCGVKFVRDEEGDAICPKCNKTPYQLANERRKNESLNEDDAKYTATGRKKLVSDETMSLAVEAARTIDPNAKRDYDDDFIYGDDGHGGSTWVILLNGDGKAYSTWGRNAVLTSKVEKAVNDAADAYWADFDKRWEENNKHLVGKKMKESALNETYYAVIEVDGKERRFPFNNRDTARDYIAKAQRGELPEFKGKKIGSTYTEALNVVREEVKPNIESKNGSVNESLASRQADTDAQEKSIKAIENTLDSLGIKVHYGTKIGKYPQTVILDIKYQDNAIYIISNGKVLINGDYEGEVNPKDKEAVKQMLIEYEFIDDDSVTESLDFTNTADVRHRLDSYSGQYLTVTFRGSYDWKYISDLLEEYNDGDEEEADLALDKLEAVYGSEYKLLKALEVDEIRGFTAMDRDIIVTIKVDKDNLYHNYADLINNPSIKKGTVKILELELNESLKKRYKKFPLKENKNKKLKEDWDDEDEEIGYCVLVNGGSPLTFSNKKDAIKKAKELIQDKFNAGKSIHIYKGNLNSESYPGWDDYDEFDGEWKEILKLEAPENFNLNSFDQYVKEKSAYEYEREDIDPEDLTYEYLDDMSASGLLNIPDKYAKDPDNVDDDEAFAYFDDLIKKYNLVDRVKKMLKESTSKEKL